MTGLPELPAANAELRRLFAAGRPEGGDVLPLMRAFLASRLVVPMHPGGGLLRMARQHARRAGEEEVCLHAFTSHELAARWAATVRDAPPESMAVASMVEICKQAIDDGVDVIDVDRGSAGYGLRFRGMMDLLSRIAFDGRNVVVFEEVKCGYGTPKSMPPAAMLDEIRAIGRAHGITQLSWTFQWAGDAPGEMQLVYAPHPSPAFNDAVSVRLNAMTRDRFTMGVHDARRHSLPPEHLHRLI